MVAWLICACGTSAKPIVLSAVNCIERVMPVANSSRQTSQCGVSAFSIEQATKPSATSTPLPISTRRKPKACMIRVVAGFIARLPANSHSSRVPASTAL